MSARRPGSILCAAPVTLASSLQSGVDATAIYPDKPDAVLWRGAR